MTNRECFLEFSLVAGGDELYPENGSPTPVAPVKLEDHYDSSNLVPFEWDESEHPNPVSPDFSPADSQSEFPPTPEHRPNLFPSDFGNHPKLHGIGLDLSYSGIGTPSTSPEGNYIHPLPAFQDSSFSMSPVEPKYTGISPHMNQYPRKVSPEQPQQSVSRHTSVTPTHQQPRPLRNKITTMFLHADGMTHAHLPFLAAQVGIVVDSCCTLVQQDSSPVHTWDSDCVACHSCN